MTGYFGTRLLFLARWAAYNHRLATTGGVLQRRLRPVSVHSMASGKKNIGRSGGGVWKMRKTRPMWRIPAFHGCLLVLFTAAIPGCGLVGPCSPNLIDNTPGDNTNDNNANDNSTGNDNTGNDNIGNDNTGNDNGSPLPTGCDAGKCSNCNADACLNITRSERFTNGALNITGVSTCSEDLAVDWYRTDKTYIETFFIFGDGRSSTVGQFDAAAASTLGGYRVRRNSQPECQCNDCPLSAVP